MRKKLYVAASPGRGRGVFAGESIEQGELIEASPVVAVHYHTRRPPKPLDDYLFFWDPGVAVLTLGYGSLYNHSSKPNATYERNQETQLMLFHAAQDIKKDEEIFVDYCTTWFEVV